MPDMQRRLELLHSENRRDRVKSFAARQTIAL